MCANMHVWRIDCIILKIHGHRLPSTALFSSSEVKCHASSQVIKHLSVLAGKTINERNISLLFTTAAIAWVSPPTPTYQLKAPFAVLLLSRFQYPRHLFYAASPEQPD